MITVEKSGKIYIPPKEGFIGYAGDNLNKTIEFQLKERNNPEYFYRVYLKFDDDTINFFILQKKIDGENTVLSWNITEDQIYKSGIVYLQIKGFDSTGEIFHTEIIPLVVGKSIEFGNYLAQKPISEFLEEEKVLNQLCVDIEKAKKFLPYIGENGNWYVYDYDQKKFVDSNVLAKISKEELELLRTQIGDLSYLNTEDKTSLVNSVNELYDTKISNTAGAVTSKNISSNSVTESKISTNAVTTDKIAEGAVTGGVHGKIAQNTIDASNIKPRSITEGLLDEEAILTNNIADSAITTDKIANNAITSAKIADNAISNISKFSHNVVDSEPIANSQRLITSGSVYDIRQNLKSRVDLSFSAAFDENNILIKTVNNTTLSGGSFGANTAIKKVFIASDVRRIESGAFAGSTNLTDIYIDKPESSIQQGALTIISGAIPDDVNVYYSDNTPYNAVADIVNAVTLLNKSITMLDTRISENFVPNVTVAFDQNGAIFSTDDRTVIGGGQFTQELRLKRVFIPSCVTKLDYGAFLNSTNLEEIIIDNVEGAVEIHPNALPKGVNIVYTNSFNIVTKLCDSVVYLYRMVSSLSEKIQAMENNVT